MSTNNSILKNMKSALKAAHAANNGKAISKDFAAGANVSEEAFSAWCTWIDTLHFRIIPWVEKWNDGKVADEELDKVYGEVMPVLRQISRVDDKLFFRSNDVAAICKMAHDFGKSANGSVDVVRGKVAFRRQIETMIGNRMAQNAALTEDEYDLIVRYERTETNLEKAENRLNGYERNGKKVTGLKDNLKTAEKTLADIKEAVIGMGGDKDKIDENPVIAGYLKTVTDIKSDIKNTEERIKKASKYLEENGKKYKEVMAKVKTIK